ncbi:MAG: hypothetical protein AAGA99_24885, partial [Actinomycetota bacterium]
MARGRVGPLGELRIVAAQIDGAVRRQDDLEVMRGELIRQALGDGLPVERIARAARLTTVEVERLRQVPGPERPGERADAERHGVAWSIEEARLERETPRFSPALGEDLELGDEAAGHLRLVDRAEHRR